MRENSACDADDFGVRFFFFLSFFPFPAGTVLLCQRAPVKSGSHKRQAPLCSAQLVARRWRIAIICNGNPDHPSGG